MYVQQILIDWYKFLIHLQKQKNPDHTNDQDFKILVGPLGLEPRLFGTKNQRVTSYTIGQNLKRECKFNTKFHLHKQFIVK